MNGKLALFIVMLFIQKLHVEEARADTQYCRNLNINNGFTSNTIYDISTDQFGKIYLGTQKGVFTFNGIKTVPLPSKHAFSESFTDINFTSSNSLWCRNFSDQLFYLINDTLQPFINSEKYSKNQVLVDIITKENTIYVAYFNTLILINNVSKSIIAHFSLHAIETMWLHGENLYVANSNGEVFELIKDKLMLKGKLPIKRPRIFTKNNKLYALSVGAELIDLYEVNLTTFKATNVIHQQLPPANQVNNLVTLPRQQIGISTTNGIYLYTAEFKLKTILNEGNISSDMLIQNSGATYVSTVDNGLTIYPNLAIKYLIKSPEPFLFLEPYLTYLLLLKANGDLLFLNKKGNVLHRIKGSNTHALTFLFVDTVSNKAYTSSGYYDLKKLTFTEGYYGKDLSIDKNGTIYIALHSLSGIIIKGKQAPLTSKFNPIPEQGKHYSFNIIKQKRTRSILATTSLHSLYIGYSDDLYAYQGNSEFRILTPNGDPIIATDIVESKDSIIWIGTLQQGLFGLVNNQVRYWYNKKNGLSSNNCKKLVVTSHQLLFISDDGIDVIDYHKNQLYAIQHQFSLTYNTYHDAKIVDHTFYALCNEGLITVPLHMPLHSNQVEVYHLSIFNCGKRVNHEVNYSNNQIEVKWEINSFLNQHPHLSYRLIGLDSLWKALQPSEQQISFNHLEPGIYKLQLRSNQHILGEYSFWIKKPIWQQHWMYVLASLIGLSVVYVLIKITQFQLQKKQQAQEQLIRYQLTAIRSQMNPHFLYNVLNSLQGLIYSNKNVEAGRFTSMFSEHLRNILNNSDKQELTIREEIDSLNTYLALEKLRFGEDFNYEVLIKNNLDEHKLIPSMLVQPFAENAVKHGLLHKKGIKSLTIHFESVNEHCLTITIADNGIGRLASMRFNEKRKDKPESFATKAIDSRIKLLNNQQKGKITLQTLDLTHLGESTGTKVILTILF